MHTMCRTCGHGDTRTVRGGAPRTASAPHMELRAGSPVLPTLGGGGGSIDKTMDQKSGAEDANRIFLGIENGQFFFHQIHEERWFFLNPLNARIPSFPVPSFIFCRSLGPGHLRGPGVRLGRILGGQSIKPFGGGVQPEGCIDHRPPPPPEVETPPTPG